MNFEETDRFMSSWVVSCVHNGTPFYLTSARLATDIFKNAAIYRYEDQALDVAISEMQNDAWRDQFIWAPIRTAEVLAAQAKGEK